MSSPEKVGSVLNSVLSDRGYLSRVREYGVFPHWKEIVGERIAAVSSCKEVENGILYVTVASSVWRQEMTFLKIDILKKIRETSDCSTIKDIIFL